MARILTKGQAEFLQEYGFEYKEHDTVETQDTDKVNVLLEAKQAAGKGALNKYLDQADAQTLEANAPILDLEVAPEFVKDITDRIRITDNGQEVDSKEYLEQLTNASLIEAKFHYLGDPEFAKHNAEEKNAIIFDAFRNLIIEKIVKARMVTALPLPSIKEVDAGSTHYTNKYAERVGSIVKDVLESDKPINLSAQSVMTACVDAELNFNDYVAQLKEKFANTPAAQKSEIISQGYGAKLKAAWGKRHEMTKAVVENIRKNKWQVALGLVGSVGITVAAATGVGTVAIAVGYLGYSSAMAWTAPAFDESHALNKEAKANGQKLDWKKSLTTAFRKKFSDPKFRQKAWTQTGFAALGGAVIGSVAGVGGNVAFSKLIGSASRILGSNTFLAVETYDANKKYKKILADPKASAKDKEIARSNYTRARGGLIAGVGIGAVVSAWGAYAASQASVAEVVVAPKVQDVPLSTPADTAHISSVVEPVQPAHVPAHEVAPAASAVADVHAATDFSTSAQVQNFYEYRVSHINQYHPLVAAKLGAGGLSGQEVVNQMLGRAGVEEWVKLPEGCTPEHAVHTAIMAAQYKGDFQLAKMLNCPDQYTPAQIEKAFAAKLPIYNSQIGVAGGIGYPTDVKYNPKIPFGSSSHIDDCHDMYNGGRSVPAPQPTPIPDPVQPTVKVAPITPEPTPDQPAPVVVPEVTYEPIQYEYNYSPRVYMPGQELGCATPYGDTIWPGDQGVESIRLEGNRLIVTPIDPDSKEINVRAKSHEVYRDVPYQTLSQDALNKASAIHNAPLNILTKVEDNKYVKIIPDGVVQVITNPESGQVAVFLTEPNGVLRNIPEDIQKKMVSDAVKELNNVHADTKMVEKLSDIVPPTGNGAAEVTRSATLQQKVANITEATKTIIRGVTGR